MSETSRKQILNRDLKLLWGRAGNRCALCKRELVHDKTDLDRDVVVGEEAHIVSASPNGPRGDDPLPLEKRYFYENLMLLCREDHKIIDEQVNTFTVDRLHRIKEDHEAWVRVKLTDAIKQKPGTKYNPVLDATFGGSGGPNGHLTHFQIKNISNDTAIDIAIRLEGFGYKWIYPHSFSLSPSDPEKKIDYLRSSEPTFTKIIPDLYIHMEYSSVEGIRFLVKREIEQYLVPSGSFYDFKLGKFIPPQVVDSSIKVAMDKLLDRTGNGIKALFQIEKDSNTQKFIVGISGTLQATWGFEEEQLIAALTELAQIRADKSLPFGVIPEYMFTTGDFKNEDQQGYEGYKRGIEKLRRI